MRTAKWLVCLATVVWLGACFDGGDSLPQRGVITEGGGSGGAPTTAAVTVGDDFFSPQEDTVAVSGTVTWTWTGSHQHDVTFDDGVASSIQTTGSFSRTFSAAGVYTYYCTVHGRTVQAGDIVVQ
jgi:plastocyanin